MKNNITTSSENFLISAAGHLIIIALMVTSFVFIAGPIEKIIASDRVQIYEIDLSKVTVSGTETLLYNTDAFRQEAKEKKQKTENKKKAEMIGDDASKPLEKNATTDSAAKPKPDASKATTIVRVNRETGALNRTMTVSVIDALRVAMTRCWQFDKDRPGLEDIRAVAHLTMNQLGMVRDLWFEQAARADTDPAFSYVLETIRMAVGACQPFKMLPASEYDAWKNIQLTFYPSNASVH
ncbi:MAG: hypothetical protein LBK26_02695 [Rickettsiales bacterium]|jgi:hypothetical protein|nr:hypothetical protein [Rickettsiales bacterium]